MEGFLGERKGFGAQSPKISAHRAGPQAGWRPVRRFMQELCPAALAMFAGVVEDAAMLSPGPLMNMRKTVLLGCGVLLALALGGCSKSGEEPAGDEVALEPPASTLPQAAPVSTPQPEPQPEAVPAENLSIQLVKDGRPLHNMYCLPNDEADPAAVMALKEYRALVAKATGTEPLRVAEPEPGRPTIFFGRNPWSEKAGVTTNGLAAEGFRIRTAGQDIHIVGRDTPQAGAHQVEAGKGMEPGTLFGTYEFLERAFGMVVAWHDDLGTVTPSQKDLAIRSLSVVDAPDWSYRQFTKSVAGEANKVFGRRLRLGHPIEVRHEHAWHRIMPPDVYGRAHPEWFAEIKGKRYPKHYAEKRGGQVCTSNPAVVAHFAKAAIEHFNKRPGSDMFSISPNDGRKFCQCARCTALDSGEMTSVGRPITTDRILTFYNSVAEKVARVHPDKRLGAIIYMDYKYPPKNVKPHPMLFLVHATNSGFAQGVGYQETEAQWERDWGRVADKFYKYDIWHYDQTPLYMIAPVTGHIIEKCQTGKGSGVDGGYSYVARSYELLGAGHYVLARLMWDNAADGRQLEKDYYRALYGTAADEVKAYYDLLEGRLKKTFADGPDAKDEAMVASFFERYPGFNNPGMYLSAYWPILPQMKAAIERAYARRKELTQEQNERLVRLIDHHNYTMHTVAAMIYAGRGLAKTGDAGDAKRFRDSVAKRDAAKERIRKYRPFYAKLLDDLDKTSHTGVLYGRKPTIVIRAPSDFNQ